jgi:hypothetical protein
MGRPLPERCGGPPIHAVRGSAYPFSGHSRQLSEGMPMRCSGGCAGPIEGSPVRPSCVRYVPISGDRRETLFSGEIPLPKSRPTTNPNETVGLAYTGRFRSSGRMVARWLAGTPGRRPSLAAASCRSGCCPAGEPGAKEESAAQPDVDQIRRHLSRRPPSTLRPAAHDGKNHPFFPNM